ncbi:hypothetical protein GQ44DRAFT_706942 [Phaeosphaeriaceae sp. PMI808]|nr:hypothetical protein GQ44DRAFT_706942 [Phaeosphaeriaceae sp. PMI808]
MQHGRYKSSLLLYSLILPCTSTADVLDLSFAPPYHLRYILGLRVLSCAYVSVHVVPCLKWLLIVPLLPLLLLLLTMLSSYGHALL